MAKFYFTTPLYYVNARPHIGHTYTTVVADTIARYQRMMGFDVCFLTGTDEHGQKVERSARAAHIAPEEFADEVAGQYQHLWQTLGLRYDRFIRTTEERHARAVRKIFAAAQKAGAIYKGHYEGQYCVFDELYVSEPAPGGRCPECGRPTELIREENYFFKLSAFQDRLLEHYDKHPEFIQPKTRRNEVVAFVRGGLRDLSISRTTLRWGIPLPTDDGHVFYVWFDALTGYLSGIGYGDTGPEAAEFARFWPADLQLVGKEILRFHAVYWPAFLLAAELPLPKTIYAHGWWLFQRDKMSKSRGNIVHAEPIAQVVGIDALRYFLLREMVFGQDANFSYDALVSRYNSDLANDLGNLVSRTLAMIERYFGGEVPAPSAPTPREQELVNFAARAIEESGGCFRRYVFARGLETVWSLIGKVNKYLVESEPWAIADDPAKRAQLATVLYAATEAVRIVTVLVHPVMPHATERIWRQLGLAGTPADCLIKTLAWGGLRPGTRIGKSEAVFPRVEKEPTIARMAELEAALETAPIRTPERRKPVTATNANPISLEDFAKVDMRVGEVRAAERVAGTNKLLKLRVDVGAEERQIVAGIAEAYTPEQLVGKKIVVVVNLEPRKIRGVESQGMLVAATVGEEGRPVIVTFTEDVPAGAPLK
ncbi:MAG: methionine--tRNA ligase [Terriglobia bacterium]